MPARTFAPLKGTAKVRGAGATAGFEAHFHPQIGINRRFQVNGSRTDGPGGRWGSATADREACNLAPATIAPQRARGVALLPQTEANVGLNPALGALPLALCYSPL